jgi:wyosine [tRNA(Phe)-imidazoG37] synthetase (radical SAM superfamily)
MSAEPFRHVYGPVPSRRLGRSLGIDLVPFKTCTYDCIYCQLGRTTNKTAAREAFLPVERVLEEVKRKLAAGAEPEYITLAGSGEPTLHSGIGELIRGLKRLTDIPAAVLTNGSLLWVEEVREDLLAADVVIPSLDAGGERLFRYVNRPHRGIVFERMVDGLAGFTARFRGEVWLEVFLLAELTGIPSEAERIAALVRRIAPARTQLGTVCRPPAEPFAHPVSAPRMRELARLFPGNVEVLGPSVEEQPGKAAGVPEADILSVIRRHPCTARDAAECLGIHVAEALKLLNGLAAAGKAKTAVQDGRTYYLDVESGASGGK